MQNKRTFISFVGKGHLSKNEKPEYLPTAYDFGNNVLCSCRCFAEAVRKSGNFNFDEVVFIGTDTSSWSALLESCEENEFELWSKLFEQEQAEKPLTPEDCSKLQAVLSNLWGKPARLAVHAAELLAENCTDILNRYVAEIFAAGNDILLDITHSFRWMPLLLTSAMQYKNAFGIENCKFEIIYGEYRQNAASPVRWVNELVEGQEVADAIALFFQKFEAAQLAAKLQPYWERGADIIKNLAIHLQGNYFLPLLFNPQKENFPASDLLNQLKNQLHKFDSGLQPVWVKEVHKNLQNIYQQLTVDDPTDRLLNLAEILSERKLYGQAVTCICLAVEQWVLQYFGAVKHPGYEKLQDLKEKIKTEVSYKESSIFRKIQELRNQVAHGGLPDSPVSTNPATLQENYKKLQQQFINLKKSINK